MMISLQSKFFREATDEEQQISPEDQYVRIDIYFRHYCRVIGETENEYELISVFYVDHSGGVRRSVNGSVFKIVKVLTDPVPASEMMRLTMLAKK